MKLIGKNGFGGCSELIDNEIGHFVTQHLVLTSGRLQSTVNVTQPAIFVDQF